MVEVMWTGNELAAFLLGMPRQLSRVVSDFRTEYRLREWGAFFQDDFKATRNLTLNLGLRYMYFTPPYTTDDRYGSFVYPVQCPSYSVCGPSFVGFMTHTLTHMPIAVPAIIGIAAVLFAQDYYYLKEHKPTHEERTHGVLAILEKDIEWPTLAFFLFLFDIEALGRLIDHLGPAPARPVDDLDTVLAECRQPAVDLLASFLN